MALSTSDVYRLNNMNRVASAVQLGTALQGGTSSSPITTSSAANLFAHYYSSTATSGDVRAMYLKLWVGGAGGSGEALRSYSLATVASVTQLHGAHITGELNAGTGVSGQCVGVRATVASATGLTVGTGQYVGVRIDSSFKSAMPASWAIEVYELESNKFGYFLNVTGTSGVVLSSFSGNATKMDKALKVRIEGVNYWIPLQNATS